MLWSASEAGVVARVVDVSSASEAMCVAAGVVTVVVAGVVAGIGDLARYVVLGSLMNAVISAAAVKSASSLLEGVTLNNLLNRRMASGVKCLHCTAEHVTSSESLQAQNTP